ncbi:MAG: mechanosensitive ion channel domain-containing protein [Candidatus Hodarchaeota archaeon]
MIQQNWWVTPPWSFLLWWAIFAISLVLILVLYKIILYFTRKTVGRYSEDLLNGVKFVLRLVFIIVGFSIFSALSTNLIPGGIPNEIALIIAAVTGTVFALSTTTVVQNFIAGLYIILTRPYRIGHLIKIGDREGIVEEISLNYTKLRRQAGVFDLISNQSVISAKILNYTITRAEHDRITGKGNEDLKSTLLEKEITRYAFDLTFPKMDPLKLKEILNGVAEKYDDRFKYKPEFVTAGFLRWPIVSFILVSDDPETILRHKPDFVKEIFSSLG